MMESFTRFALIADTRTNGLIGEETSEIAALLPLEINRKMDRTMRGPINIHLAEDGLSLLLDCSIREEDIESACEVILERMSLMKIVRHPDQEQILTLLRHLADHGEEVTGFELVKGRPPIQPVDGKIIWEDDYFNPGFVVDNSSGKIDYNQRVAQCSVMEGDRLATVLPAAEGVPGVDLLGREIRVRRVRSPRINAGDHVRHDKETGAYTAAASGRIRWGSGYLSVDRVYTIRGNVGPETGHISHPGAIVVNGDVQEGYQIEAFGDIDVRGIVEGAHIQTTGNLMVSRGIVGERNGQIAVSGDVHARFIVGANMIVGGNVMVEKEIVQSDIQARGMISVLRGRIVGGRVTALNGVEVAQAGSVACIPTKLVAGEDHELYGMLLAKQKEKERVEKNLAKVRMNIQSLRSRIEAGASAPSKKLKTLLEREKMNEISLDVIDCEMHEIRAESDDRVLKEIRINRKVYPETHLRIDEAEVVVQDEIRGPVKAVAVGEEIVLTDTRS